MAETTGIAWTRSTFNPWIGCTKVGPGCDHCYAEAQDSRKRWGGVTHWGAGVSRQRTSLSNWNQPTKWNRRAEEERHTGIVTRSRTKDEKTPWPRPGFWPVFCASLADVFDNEVPEVWRDDLFHLIADTPSLTWLLLTKRIGNVARMTQGYWPMPNVWLGATIVNQMEADRDAPKLLAEPATVRFVSYEPALGPVDWARFPGINWIIVGGESEQPGQPARPFDIGWARSTVQQCQVAHVPVFVKQLGSHPCRTEPGSVTSWRYRDRAGTDPAEWPEELRVREFPA